MSQSENCDRRQFLHTTSSALAMGVAASAVSGLHAAETASLKPIRLGAPVFNAGKDPEELALAHRKLGMRAAYCPPVALNDTQRIRALQRAFAKHDVVIAEVGRWKNLLDPDPVARRANMDFVIEGLALADEIGARCCVDIAGSYNADVWYGPHPDNVTEKFFDAAVENARKIIDAVKPKRAKFSYEDMGWSLPDSPDSYVRMIKAVDRPAFGAHLDPCNLINSPDRFYHNSKLLNECFDKLGPWIVSCHAKDVAWDPEMQVHFREVVLGTGKLDYATYLRRVAQLPHDVPLMIEHMQGADQYAQSRQYVFAVGKRIGVRFE